MTPDQPLRNQDGTFTPAGAVVAGAKGGATPSEYRDLALSLANRKYCVATCPIFERCPLMPIAQESTAKKKPCMLKDLSPVVKTRILRIFYREKDGLLDEIRAVLCRHGLAVHAKQQDRRDAKEPESPGLYETEARLLMDFFRLVYGERKQVDVTGAIASVGIPDDPDLYREIGDLLAARMNKPPGEENR